jgi:hypothetical protein
MSSDDLPEPLKRAERFAGQIVDGAERLAERVAPQSERDLIQRALDLSARKKLLLARRLWRDPRVRKATRLPMFAGTLYMLLPIRLIPMRFAAIRPWEKLIGLGLVLWMIARLTPDDILREHLDAVERPGRISRVFGRSPD